MLQTIRELIEILQQAYQSDEMVTGFIWGEEDIASIAKNCNVTLSEREMRRIICRLNCKDSRNGFGWKDIMDEICRIEVKKDGD